MPARRITPELRRAVGVGLNELLCCGSDERLGVHGLSFRLVALGRILPATRGNYLWYAFPVMLFYPHASCIG